MIRFDGVDIGTILASGLIHCQCPECGMEDPLDELWRLPAVTPKAFEKPDRETATPAQEEKRPLQP